MRPGRAFTLSFKMRNLRWLLLLVSMACVPAVQAADEDVPSPDRAAGVDFGDEKVIEKGLHMLNSTCGGYCHGTEGRGFKAPPLRNRPELSVDSLRTVILFGRKRAGKLMPGWKDVLSEEDVWTVIAAIVSLRHAESTGEEAKGGGH